MRTLAFLAILQSLTTGAYLAACAGPSATSADWLSGVLLVILSCLFSCYTIVSICAERGQKAGSNEGR